MMTIAEPAELLALAPSDLAELLAAAPGQTWDERAEALGLTPTTDQIHRDATDVAVATIGGQGSLDPKGMSIPELLDTYRGTGRPFLGGTFALYAEETGGIVIVTETPAFGVQQTPVPAALVKLVLKPSKIGRLMGVSR